jgi:hypothetical protein
VKRTLLPRLDGLDVDVRLLPHGPTEAHLRFVVRGDDEQHVGRGFSQAAVELALANYPGFHTTSPPGDASPYGIYRAEYVPAAEIVQTVVLDDGSCMDVPPTPGHPLDGGEPAPTPRERRDFGETTRAPLGLLFGARSGDKGGDANVGFWARDEDSYAWLAQELTGERVRELLPEAHALAIDRYELPNIRALNFVLHGLLGEGVAASTRPDPQAKSLGEVLRAQEVELPVALLDVRPKAGAEAVA